ncbi:MAG: LPXTG cell wall anchor domain-containing protein [Microbacteriaceae bacterium]
MRASICLWIETFNILSWIGTLGAGTPGVLLFTRRRKNLRGQT